MKKILLNILFLCLCSIVVAQQVNYVRYRFEPNSAERNGQAFMFRTQDSIPAEVMMNRAFMHVWAQGYLSAHVADSFYTPDTLNIRIKCGKAYNISQIKSGNVPEEWITSAGIKTGSWKQRKFIESEFQKEINNILRYAENNGYPFAIISLDSVEADTTSWTATLHLDTGPLIYFDSIICGGDARVAPVFLQLYSGIKPGKPYHESLVKNLNARFSELPYVQVVHNQALYFYGNKVRPYVYLNQKKASSFDGVVGFAPNSSVNNKLIVTGDLNLKLVNLGGSGKSLEFRYQGYLSKSQELQVKLLWPYFLKSKLALEYAFRLNKYDTTWLEIFQDFGLQYRFSGVNYLKLFYQRKNIQTLWLDTNYMKQTLQLPAVHDVKTDYYGLAWRKSTLNYFLNPTAGILIEADAAAGMRRIIPNPAAQNLSADNGQGTYNFYDSVTLKTMQYKATFDGSAYQKIYGHWVGLLQIKAGVMQGENLFINELFRIGGLKSLKGFDEQSIFASSYLILNSEVRYLFQQNAAFILFWNGASYRNDVPAMHTQDKPWGAGAGMKLETPAGLFSLYYAVGSQKGNQPEFKSAKIHFGLVNYF